MKNILTELMNRIDREKDMTLREILTYDKDRLEIVVEAYDGVRL